MPLKPIRVKSEKEFGRLRDRINREVSHARHHWSLLKEIEKARADYSREINESYTFWYLTSIAHREAVLSHLGRLYDDTNGTLSLSGFLETVRANRNFFSDIWRPFFEGARGLTPALSTWRGWSAEESLDGMLRG